MSDKPWSEERTMAEVDALAESWAEVLSPEYLRVLCYEVACLLHNAMNQEGAYWVNRLAELEAQLAARWEWEPVVYSAFIGDHSHNDTYLISTLGGTQLEIGTDPTAGGLTVNLPSSIRLCRRTVAGEGE